MKTFHSSLVTLPLHTSTTASLECGHLLRPLLNCYSNSSPSPDVLHRSLTLLTFPCRPLPSPIIHYCLLLLPGGSPLYPETLMLCPVGPADQPKDCRPSRALGSPLLTSPRRVQGLLGTLKEGAIGSLGTLEFRGSDAVISLCYVYSDRFHSSLRLP